MLKVSEMYMNMFQFEAAIRSARNALNSWDKSDTPLYMSDLVPLGDKDLKMLQRLAKGGDDDAKCLRFLTFTMDIEAPLYWWKQFMTYRVGVEVGSCSTMHTIHKRVLTLDDFATENLSKYDIELLNNLISNLNHHRAQYFESKDKQDWYAMIKMLPDSFIQKRTVLMNYQVAHRMYVARKNHKLDEWHTLLDMIITLPYFKEIYGIEE